MGGVRGKPLKSATLIVPGILDAPTGGYIYDRRVARGLRDRGWRVNVIELDGSFPHPTPSALVNADSVLGHLADGTVALIDGLAFGAMPSIAQAHSRRLLLVPIVHLPLAEDVGLDPKVAARLEAEERLALESARLVITTGDSASRTLKGYGVPSERIVLAQPGTDAAPLAHGSGSPVLGLLCVATLNPGKGHAMLLRALSTAPHRRWYLTCVGSLTRHPATVADVRRLLGEHDLLDQVSLTGELGEADVSRCFEDADVFVLPTLRETYGMAVAEAIAHGVPVVSTATGAIPSLVGRDAGLLAPPGDEAAFAAALHRVLSDDQVRLALRDGARQARQRLRRWDETFDTIAGALDGVAR